MGLRIIKDTPSMKYGSWEEVVADIKARKVNHPDITTGKLINDIETIEGVSHKTFFSKPQLVYISNLFNQIEYFKPKGRFSFVEDLHIISCLITRLKQNPASYKLFNKGIFTNFGFFTQFLVSTWLNKYLNVIDFEFENKPFYTDVLVNENGQDINFHIKDIREEEREERLSDLCLYIDHYFTEKARQGSAIRHLAVTKIDGVPLKGVPTNYWLDFASKIEEKPQKVEVTFDPKDGYGNSEKVTVRIQLGFRPSNGMFVSLTSSFNTSLRLMAEYEKIDNLITNNNENNVLIGVTDDSYPNKSLRTLIERRKLGIMTLEVFDYEFIRSKCFFIKNNTLEGYINIRIPKVMEF